MCGLLVSINRVNRVELTDFVGSLNIMESRGPDSSGVKELIGKADSYAQCILGHKRLSILDLSESGHQPMTSGPLHIVYNGEVYNYLELRKNLMAAGYEFSSSSDTEVILNSFKYYGKDCVKYFDGMFAFVIFDELTGDVFFSRDRFGEKPIYWYESEEQLLISSDCDAIRKLCPYINDLSDQYLNNYLTLGYPLGDVCIYKGIRRLSPGASVFRNGRSGSCIISGYTDISWDSDNSKFAYDDPVDELEEILTDSVRLRTRSDVPIGILLSGGVDSTLVASFLAGVRSDINAFSMSFNGMGIDEGEIARLTSRRLNFTHHTVRPLDSDFVRIAQKLVQILDEPISDTSLIPQTLICEFASQSRSVVLTGDGADELFSGYPFFERSVHYNSYSKHLFKWPSSLALSVLSNEYSKVIPERLIRLLGLIGADNVISKSFAITAIDPRRLVKNKFFGVTVKKENHSTDKSHLLEYYTKNYLPNNILKKTDRASMYSSVELRAPFLTANISRFAHKLRLNREDRWMINRKSLLRILLERRMPKSGIPKSKHGFVPSVMFLTNGPLAPWCRNGLMMFDEFSKKRWGIPIDEFFHENERTINDYRTQNRKWGLASLGHWLSNRGFV